MKKKCVQVQVQHFKIFCHSRTVGSGAFKFSWNIKNCWYLNFKQHNFLKEKIQQNLEVYFFVHFLGILEVHGPR